MAFRLEEFKKTNRKGASGGPSALYPHQIKDKKVLARLDIAIRTFDASVGRRRRDMDAQAMIDFFGDPRLARGIVACLGRFYRYETPDFGQMVGRDAAGRLREAGLNGAREIRALTYAYVNLQHDGFLTEAGRAACYGELGARFCLTAQQWDVLLHLDAEENQLLTRPGAVPTPADIVALYNFHSLETPLRRATQITLAGLSLTSADAADIRALARALGVQAIVSHDSVMLRPGADCSLIARRPIGLSRCLLHLIQAYATRLTTCVVETNLASRKFRLLLSADHLRVLGMPAKCGDDKPAFRRRFEAARVLQKDLLKLRAKGEGRGWKFKRLPEPIVTSGGVLLPDFTLTRDDAMAHVFLGTYPTPAPQNCGFIGVGGGASRLVFTLGRKEVRAADVLAQAEGATRNLFALTDNLPPAIPGDFRTLCDRAASQGMVRAADARRALHLLDESPLIEWVRQAADPRVQYIPGVGLCSQEMVAAIRSEPASSLPAAS